MTPFTQQIPRHLYAFGAGVAAGSTVGTVGWGGAQVLIPSLTAKVSSLAGYSQLSATGISLTSLSTSTFTSGYKFWNEGQVHVPFAMMIGLPAVFSARLGTLLARRLSGDALALIFNACSIVLIPTHFWIQDRAKHRRQQKQQPLHHQEQEQHTNKKVEAMSGFYDVRENPAILFQFVSFGFFQGILSSLMGVGGLPLSMSYLTEMTNLDHHCVQGTAVCAVLPSILTSAASRVHAIPLAPAGFVCFGAIIGGYGGAKLALSLSNDQLHYLYMGSLLVFGGRSMVGALINIRRLLLQNPKR